MLLASNSSTVVTQPQAAAVIRGPISLADRFRRLLTGTYPGVGRSSAQTKTLMAIYANVANKGIYPLLTAVCDNDEHLTRWLLQKGANPNVGDVCDAETPLMAAVRRENKRLILILLHWHADPHFKGELTAESALTIAAALRRKDILDILQKARPQKKGNYSCTLCESYFSCKSKLERHMLVHTQRKDFKCSCGKSYSQKPTLHAHRRKYKCI